MVDLFLTKIVPVLGIFLMVGGAIGLAFVIGLRFAPGPVKVEGSDELADEKRLAKSDLAAAGFALFVLVSGGWLRWGGDPRLKGEFLICLGVAGTLIVVTTLWPEIRRTRPPLEPEDDEQLVEDQSEFEAWAQKEAAADLELQRYHPSNVATYRDRIGNLICRIRFAKTESGEASFIAERDPKGINRIHVRIAERDPKGKRRILVRSVKFPPPLVRES